MNDPSERRPPLLDTAQLATLRERLTGASGLLLCLDFDGTLAPIVDDPDDATMTRAAEALLRRLAGDPDVTVALVSGRSLTDLRERAGLDGVQYAGNHGLEWDDGSGRTVAEPIRETRPAVERALGTLREELADVPGCRVEDKGLTGTVHYRETPAERTDDVVGTVEDVVTSTDGIRCTRGKAIFELRPDVPAGKGRAVERLREQYPDYVPMFVGDDVTDEDGFRAVADDGIGVLVGDRSDTAASMRVPDTDGVAMLLAWLIHTFVASPGTRPE
jgi:trehalose 6-phosphate phosphatase